MLIKKKEYHEIYSECLKYIRIVRPSVSWYVCVAQATWNTYQKTSRRNLSKGHNFIVTPQFQVIKKGGGTKGVWSKKQKQNWPLLLTFSVFQPKNYRNINIKKVQNTENLMCDPWHYLACQHVAMLTFVLWNVSFYFSCVCYKAFCILYVVAVTKIKLQA